MLALELLDEVVDETVIEILTTKVNVTSGGLDFEDTFPVDGQEGNIESSSSEIEDEDVALTNGLIETVGDSSSSGLIDDTEDAKARDGTSVLGGLTVRH